MLNITIQHSDGETSKIQTWTGHGYIVYLPEDTESADDTKTVHECKTLEQAEAIVATYEAATQTVR